MKGFVRAIALALSVVCSLPAPGAAEEPQSLEKSGGRANPEARSPERPDQRAADSVSLERVLEIARGNAPAIAAAQARLLQAEGQRELGTVLPDPQVIATVGRGEPRDGGDSRDEAQLEIAQSLPALWGLRARGRAGDARIQAARDEVEAVTAEIVLEAKRRYYEATIAQAQAHALAEAAKDALSLRDVVARRVDAGESPEADRLRTRVEARRTELEASAASAEADSARAALNRFLLGTLGPDFSIPPDLDLREVPSAPENLVDVAVSRNPAYRSALSRVEAARWSVKVESAARLPGLELSAFGLRELDREATGASLGVTIPLWNRNQGGVGIARGELAAAEADALGLRARIEAEVERLMRMDRVAREVAISYREEIIPAATESLSIARFSLEQGEASLLNWLESRRSYLEVLRASYSAELEAFITRAELERLVGDFDGPESP